MIDDDGRPPPTQWAGPPHGSSADRHLADRVLSGEEQTVALAQRLAPIVRSGDVLALWGDLGSGKTVFARALVRARGSADEEVPSPTFTLVQVYEPAEPQAAAVWHFDLYRIGGPDDAVELGLEEALATGVCLIEWPDRLGPLLPERRLDLVLDAGDAPDYRRLRLAGDAAWRQRLREAGLV